MEYGPSSSWGVSKPSHQTTPSVEPTLRVVRPICCTPPAAVQQELDVAARVLEELASRQVSLHLEVDHQAGRVRVQVLNRDGAVLREITHRSLLDTLSGGGPVEQRA